MNWQQIAADVLQPYPNVKASQIFELASQLASVAEDFIAMDLDLPEDAKIDEARGK